MLDLISQQEETRTSNISVFSETKMTNISIIYIPAMQRLGKKPSERKCPVVHIRDFTMYFQPLLSLIYIIIICKNVIQISTNIKHNFALVSSYYHFWSMQGT